MRLLSVALLACWAGASAAQTVAMNGRLGDKALLMIDGKPRTVAVGATVDGVTLVSVTADGSVVELAGKRHTVPLGGTQVNLGGGATGGGSRIVLTASSGGHFIASGSINGKATQFLVDTGATSIAIGQGEADRLGIPYRDARVALASTANGQVAVRRVMLPSVRLGDVQVYEVEAIVVPGQMPYVLLGNSFLTRFQMKRENDVMTLDKRP